MVAESVMHCMADISCRFFHHCKVVTFIITCNYSGMAGHKDFQLTNNQKYGSNGGGGTRGVGSGGRSSSTVHHVLIPQTVKQQVQA